MTDSSTTVSVPAPGYANGPLPAIAAFHEDIRNQWDAFVQTHPKGTFFHQTGWKRVMENSYGYQPHYFYTQKAGEITGIAPTFLVSNWITGRCLISLPFAVYGGICAINAESEGLLLGHLEHLAVNLKVQYLELRNRNGGLMPGYHANSRHATFTIPVAADARSVYDRFPKDVRYMIRKGEKAGLRARHGFDQMDSFYHLMTVNLRRLGTPAFPRTLFENLVREYPGQVDLTIVYAENRPIAGGMSFFFRDWMQPYYIGALDEAKGLAGNNFLWWELIKTACERGLGTFDFGRSKKESGNYAFKAKWNPTIESLDYQVRLFGRTDVPNFSPTNSKFELATNLWKKIPLGVTRAIGPHVVRWFP